MWVKIGWQRWAKEPLSLALDLGKLYEQMMKALLPKELIEPGTQSAIKEQVELINKIKAKEKTYDKLKAKRNREKQFNRKAELNNELKQLKKEIDQMKHIDTK